jgi:tetratricopeptide (TPR) repeat protein
MVVQDYSIKHVFVGRDDEIKTLLDLLNKARAGAGQIVTIMGEHGIGKTRLIEEFRASLNDEYGDKLNLLYGRCKRAGGKDPYQPFIDALNYKHPISTTRIYPDKNLNPGISESVESNSETDLADSISDSENEFKNENENISEPDFGSDPFLDPVNNLDPFISAKPLGLIPIGEPQEDDEELNLEDEPKTTAPIIPVSEPLPMGLIPAAFRTTEVDDIKKRRSYLYERMTSHLFNLTKSSPVVMFIDDFQWVDSASIGYLQYLSEAITDKPILMIITICTDELSEMTDKNEKITELLLNLDNFGNYQSMTLSRFNKDDVSSIIKKVFSRKDVPEGFIEQIFKKTEGNPLFIEDTIRGLIDEDIIDVSNYVWETRLDVSQLKILDSTREVLINRLRKVNKDALKILSYAAVIGREFTFDLLEKVTEENKEKLLDYVDTLLEAKLILEDLSSEEDQYRFDNPIIQDIAYSQLSRSRRRFVHTKIGNIFEQENLNDVGNVVFDLASHYSKGWEYKKALKYLILAGDSAIQIYAIDDARRYYLSALETLNKFDYENEIRQHEIELLSNLGYTCQMLGDWDQALEYYQTIPKLIEDFQNHLKNQGFGENTDTTKSETELIPTNWIQLKLADTYWNIAELMRFKSSWKSSERFYKTSLRLSQEIEDYHGIAQAERGRGYINWRQGKYRKALDHYDICIDFATKINDLPVIAVTYIDIGNIYNYLGEWEQAIAYYTESIEHLEKIGWLHEMGRAYNGLGDIYAKQENWENAIENFEKAEEISRKIGDVYKRGWALFNSAECYAKMNKLVRAMENCKLAEEILMRLDDRAGLALVYRNFGIIYHYKEEWATSEEYFKNSIKLLKELQVPFESGYAYMEYGLMLKSMGKIEEAKKCLVYSLEIFKSMDAKREIEHLEIMLNEMNKPIKGKSKTNRDQSHKAPKDKKQKAKK